MSNVKLILPKCFCKKRKKKGIFLRCKSKLMFLFLIPTKNSSEANFILHHLKFTKLNNRCSESSSETDFRCKK